ncbi:MAG: hypothetical protein ABIR70_18135 [Bryobacteraceae bacterium]
MSLIVARLFSERISDNWGLKELSSALVLASRVPEMVFSPGYSSFRFFEPFSAEWIWELAWKLNSESNDQRWLVVRDPFRGTSPVEIRRDTTLAEYLAVAGELHSVGEHSVAVWYSPGLEWIIWLEPYAEIGVLGMRAGSGIDNHFEGLVTAGELLEGMCPLFSDRARWLEFSQQLMANYGEGADLTDRSVEMVLEAVERIRSGQLGLIEGSRELLLLARRFHGDAEDLFAAFRDVDHNTGSMPVGAVRREWDADALAKLDRELLPYLQLQRPRVMAACEKLREELPKRYP